MFRYISLCHQKVYSYEIISVHIIMNIFGHLMKQCKHITVLMLTNKQNKKFGAEKYTWLLCAHRSLSILIYLLSDKHKYALTLWPWSWTFTV